MKKSKISETIHTSNINYWKKESVTTVLVEPTEVVATLIVLVEAVSEEVVKGGMLGILLVKEAIKSSSELNGGLVTCCGTDAVSCVNKDIKLPCID